MCFRKSFFLYINRLSQYEDSSIDMHFCVLSTFYYQQQPGGHSKQDETSFELVQVCKLLQKGRLSI